MNALDYISEFGLRLFLSKAVRKILYKSDSLIAWKVNALNERKVEKYLIDECEKVAVDINKFIQVRNKEVSQHPIWVMWWQGEANAPKVVRACIDSIKRHASGHEVIVLSEETIGTYIALPEFVTNLVASGGISITHLSDIIRLQLLYFFGGVWLDSTVYLSSDLPEELFTLPFYSVKTGLKTKDPSHGRWTTFAMFSHKHNQLILKTLELHYKYWISHKAPVDYVMFDYFIQYIVNSNRECEEMILSVPVNNKGAFELKKMLNGPWRKWSDLGIDENTFIHKLSWKTEFLELVNGESTVYTYILKRNFEQEKEAE